MFNREFPDLPSAPLGCHLMLYRLHQFALRQVEALCAGKSSGTFFHPWDCTRYVTCGDGAPSIKSCDEGSLWNSVTKRCGLPGYTDCLYAAPCQDQNAGKVADIYSVGCTKYAQCDGKSVYGPVLSCPPSQTFDANTRECVSGKSCPT
jgi:hypothetical protein